MALPWCMFHVMSATFFGPPSGPDEFPQESLAQRVCNLDKSFLGSWVLLRVEEVWDTWILYIYCINGWKTIIIINHYISRIPIKTTSTMLGGGNSNIFYVHSYFGKMNPFWRSYFWNGLKPPTRYYIYNIPTVDGSEMRLTSLTW